VPHSTAGYSHCTSPRASAAQGTGRTAPGAAPGCCFAWTPSQILPGESRGGGEEESGPGAALAPAAGQPLKALISPPASQPGPHRLTHPWLPAPGKAPSPTARCEQEPCSQLCGHQGQLSSATRRARVKGCLGWPLTTSQGPARHPHTVRGHTANHRGHGTRPPRHAAGSRHVGCFPALLGSEMYQLLS